MFSKLLNSLTKKNPALIHPDLSPSERIPTLIREHVFPVLAPHDFRLSASGLTCKRKTDHFTHTINIYKNQRNAQGAVCAFEIWANITSPTYNRWYKKTYGESLKNDQIYSNRIQHFPNSDVDAEDYNYHLEITDNYAVVDQIHLALTEAVLPFLDQIQTLTDAVNMLKEQNHWHKLPMMLDWCDILEDHTLARELVDWFEQVTLHEDTVHVDDAIHTRRTRLNL